MSSAPSIPPPHAEAPPAPPQGDGRWPRWPPIFALAAPLLGFGATLVLALPLFAFGNGPVVTNLATFVQDLCLIAAAIFFASRVARPAPAQFGLRPTRFWPALGWAVLTFAVFFLALYAWTNLIDQGTNNDETAKALGADRDSIALVALAAFLTAVVAPFAEEFLFRGFIYAALRTWSRWGAAIVTGLMFGAVHALGAPWQNLIPLAILGFLLCLLRERTDSIYPGIALHCANNAIAFGALRHWDAQILPLFAASALVIYAIAILVRVRFGP